MSATKALGTILPTKASLALSDDYAASQDSLNRAFAKSHRILSDCEPSREAGEIRYYLTNRVYATVRHQRARWFEIRQDGHYSISESKAVSL